MDEEIKKELRKLENYLTLIRLDIKNLKERQFDEGCRYSRMDALLIKLEGMVSKLYRERDERKATNLQP